MEESYKLLLEKLIGDVTSLRPSITENPNGANEFSCPFCGAQKKSIKNEFIFMSDLKHDHDCMYLAAVNYYKEKPDVLDEYILCSAIKFNGQIISGFRHKDCWEIIDLIQPDHDQLHSCGFLTSKNRFVNRKEGWKIAKANNQIKYGLKASDFGDNSILTSENLYLDPEDVIYLENKTEENSNIEEKIDIDFKEYIDTDIDGRKNYYKQEYERKYCDDQIEIRLYCGHKKCNKYIKGIEGYNGMFTDETGQHADLRNQEWRCEEHS